MTWDELAALIAKMPAARRRGQVLIRRLPGEPDESITPVRLVRAAEDVYEGISIGNVIVLGKGDYYFSDDDA